MGYLPLWNHVWLIIPNYKSNWRWSSWIGELTLRRQIQALRIVMKSICGWVQEKMPINVTDPIYLFKPGDSVWFKRWNPTTLEPKGDGPHTIILSTPTAVKVAGAVPWIYHNLADSVESSSRHQWQHPYSSHTRSWLCTEKLRIESPALVAEEVDQLPPSGSLRFVIEL